MTKRNKIILGIILGVAILAVSLWILPIPPLGYEVIEENGSFYISYFGDGKEVSPNESKQLELASDAWLYFDSLKEMKNDFRWGTFTNDELDRISRYFYKDETGRIIIPDMNNLFDVELPDAISVSQIVCYQTGTYRIEFGYRLEKSIGEAYTGGICRSSESSVKEKTENWMPEVLGKMQGQPIEDRNAMQYENNNTATTTWRYIIEDGDRVLYVQERYHQNEAEYFYEIYGDAKDMSFYVSLINCSGRLSVEEISAFGLVPYNG